MTISAILLDIEGTTTPIDFVHKTLFPFAKKKIGEFVGENWCDIQPEILQLKTEHAVDDAYSNGLDKDSPASVTKYLDFLIDADRKSTPLKSLQGKVWQKGYEAGELTSEVFDDVSPAFNRWKSEGKTIAIYSSGSVLAQKLLFSYTDHGDLTPFITDYFDTNIGAKREAESYGEIAGALDISAAQIVFVSDIIAELDAARSRGFRTALSVRKGNAAIDDDNSHRRITSFDELG